MPRLRQLIDRVDATAERGFTLVELLIYGLLLLVVLGVVGGMLISTQAVGTQVRESTETTSQAQLAAESVTAGIRNASAFQVADLADDQVVMARVAGGGEPITWRCMAWYYSDADQAIYQHQSTSPFAQPTSAADVAGWQLLASGIVPTSLPGVFKRVNNQLEVAFEGRSPGSSAVTVSSSAAVRAQVWEAAPCF